jgi:hypothetical protein
MASLAERLGDWLSYRPSDFLMFSPRTYWRLFELHNEAWGPLPWVMVAVAVVAIVWIALRSANSGAARAAMSVTGAGLAAALVFVAWAFVIERYEPINWAAPGLAVLLVMLAVGVAALAWRGERQADPSRAQRKMAVGLALFALFGHPLLAPLAGRPLGGAEVIGLTPDPTVIAAIAWLLWHGAPASRPGLALWRGAVASALLCAAASAATLAVMEEWPALVPSAAALIAAASLVTSRRSSARRRLRA